MLDVDGDSRVTYLEMIEVIRDCRATGADMRASHDPSHLPESLRRLAAAVQVKHPRRGLSTLN
jgi:hypothetical protein